MVKTTRNVDSVIAEKAITSMVLSYPDLFNQVRSYVFGFKDPNYKFILDICLEFDSKGNDWTWEIIADACSKIDSRPRELKFPVTFISELVIASPTKDQIGYFIGLYNSIKVRESLGNKIDLFKDKLNDPTIPVSDLYSDIKGIEDLFIPLNISTTRIVNNRNFWDELKKDIVKIQTTPFLGSGWRDVDANLTWGFAPGHISLIGGRPSMGKSSVVSNIQKNFASDGIHTIKICKEQRLANEYFRWVSMITGMNVQDIVKGFRLKGYANFNKDDFSNAIKSLFNVPHTIVEPDGIFYLKDINPIIEDCRKQGYDPKVVFIDLFNQLDDINVASDPGNKAGLISKKILEAANYARIYNIHYCLVVQLRRSGKDRDKIDSNELWKESGSYEERADLAFQVSRPGYYKPDEIEDNRIFIMIAKQRDGIGRKIIELEWDSNCFLISDLNRSDVSDYGEESFPGTF